MSKTAPERQLGTYYRTLQLVRLGRKALEGTEEARKLPAWEREGRHLARALGRNFENDIVSEGIVRVVVEAHPKLGRQWLDRWGTPTALLPFDERPHHNAKLFGYDYSF